MTMSDSMASKTGSNDLTPEALHKFLVSMKGSIQMARISIIHHHARLIAKLKTMVKKASAKDDQKTLSASALKNKRKATKLKNEVKTLKNLTDNDIGKLVLLNTKDFNTVNKEGAGAGVSAICRVSEHKAVSEQKLLFKDQFGESVSQLPFCVKVLGAERRSRKLRKLKTDKKGRMLEYDRRLFKLVKEIGGEEFEAAERLYLKVLNMKKSLEKRKKTEKAWAEAQGPLGDRKVAYEDYLKTVKEGEEKETFESYTKKFDESQETSKSDSELSDDEDLDNSEIEESEDESPNAEQLELRNKIFEKLDSKFGKWNDDDDEMSDIDDVEITPEKLEPKSSDSTHRLLESKPFKLKLATTEKNLSSVTPSTKKINPAKKRKLDSNSSDVEISNNVKNSEPGFGESIECLVSDSNMDCPRPGLGTTTASRMPQVSAQAATEDKNHSSLFSLFKKTGLSEKISTASTEKKTKQKEPFDENIKKMLYCDEDKSVISTFEAAASSSAGPSFFRRSKGSCNNAVNDVFVPSKKRKVLKNELELAEIPESIVFAKAQKLKHAALTVEGHSDDEREELPGFNSAFILEQQGQRLLQHQSLRGGKRGRARDSIRGKDSRGGGRRGMGHFKKDDGDLGGNYDEEHNERENDNDDGFFRAKFDRGNNESGRKRGRGRGRIGLTTNSRFENDDTALHPSWAAKRQNSGAIAEFLGKKTVFN